MEDPIGCGQLFGALGVLVIALIVVAALVLI
jgi:hypothetical protein